jgi:hypothetical protein
MSFWLLVTDSDNNVFSLPGPMSDDTDWANRVAAAQKRGRRVNWVTIAADADRAALVERAKTQGFTEGAVDLGWQSN